MSPPDPAAPLRWRLLIDAARDGARNMALDHALAECLEPGEGVLRLYAWDPATISFGRHEPTRDRYDVDEAARRGVAFVRRPTGGRAVLHDREVTYAVAAPLRAFGGPRHAYRAINRGLVEGLRALGVVARVTEDGQVMDLDSGPCFGAPAPGEVVGGSRKLVGSAQARVGGALLQHGSVLLEGDQSPLAELAGRPADALERPATVRELVPAPVDDAEVVAALAAGCRVAWGGGWSDGEYLPRERDAAARLVEERYGRDAWTWRR